MKIKHNKKRNTAFVFEALVKEVTIAVLKNDPERKEKTISLVKKHFGQTTVLGKHLECYRSLYESHALDEKTCEKILNEAKMASRLLDTQGLFISQTDLIDDVNKELSPQIFNNFVPNYKTLASIYQIFSTDSSPKDSVILENQLIEEMAKLADNRENLEPIDNITLNSFISKFNEKYRETLSEEQKELLGLYISSFADNSLGLKSFLNEEIPRLKTIVEDSHRLAEIKEDVDMKEKTKQIVDMLEDFSKQKVSEKLLIKVLKTQELAQELIEDVSND